MPSPVVVAVPARAALAGNPSDLYGGAVLAVPVWSLLARVEVVDGPAPLIEGAEDGRHLVAAAASRIVGGGSPPVIRWRTDIPRSVGLGGSSAIVVATLRALAERAGTMLAELDLARLALAVEVDDLGYVAGLQDRAVQAFAAPVLVDVAGADPVVTPLRPARPLEIAVAWLPSAAESSDAYHRRAAPPPAAMAELARVARGAADAFADGDAAALADLMGESAQLRSEAAPLPAAHDRLAAAVADAGLAPNSAGSGGAVAAVVTGTPALDRATATVRALGGDVVVEVFG